MGRIKVSENVCSQGRQFESDIRRARSSKLICRHDCEDVCYQAALTSAAGEEEGGGREGERDAALSWRTRHLRLDCDQEKQRRL